jgi:hypothetical protein
MTARTIYFAALTQVDLDTACEQLARRLYLPTFDADEGWECANSQNADLALNLTKILEFSDPNVWGWMWGAPAKANAQIVVRCGHDVDLLAITSAIEQALECRLEPYPAGFFPKSDAERL